MGKICKLNQIDDNFARLLKPMVLEAGQHFTIRDHGGTIGTGFKLFLMCHLQHSDFLYFQERSQT